MSSRPKRFCQRLPRSEFLHIVSLESAFIRKSSSLFYPLNRTLTWNLRKKRSTYQTNTLRKVRRVTSYRNSKSAFIFSFFVCGCRDGRVYATDDYVYQNFSLSRFVVSSTSRTQGEDDHDGAAKGKVSLDAESTALSDSSEQPYLADR